MTNVTPSSVTLVADQVFATPDGHPLLADLYLPDSFASSRPVIVWLHGGAWRLGDRHLCPDLSRHFAARGFAMVSVDYRLSQHQPFPAQIEDVKTAIRWIRHVAEQYSLDPAHIGVWGSSAGGHLAALAAISQAQEFVRSDAPYAEQVSMVQAAVIGYPPVDFLQMDAATDSPESQLIGAPVRVRPDLAANANPISYMHDRVPPCLILHGVGDAVIPPRQSELLYVALVAHGNAAALCLVDDLGHGFLNETDLDVGGPRSMSVRSSSDSTEAAPIRQSDYVFALIERFFREALCPITSSTTRANALTAGTRSAAW